MLGPIKMLPKMSVLLSLLVAWLVGFRRQSSDFQTIYSVPFSVVSGSNVSSINKVNDKLFGVSSRHVSLRN